jgi:hypothetical protein
VPFAQGRPLTALEATLLAIMLLMLVVWLCVCVWTFRRLSTRHAAVYESLGSPSLFRNNTPKTNLQFFVFLYSFRWRRLDDSALARVCWVMVILLPIYLGLFAGLIAVDFAGLRHH